MTHKATMISIVTEKLIEESLIRVINEAGASGYSVFAGGGKGAHGTHAEDRASVVGAFSNVKIEVIVSDRAKAEAIAETVTERFFKDYSGIIYLQDVEVLRPGKF